MLHLVTESAKIDADVLGQYYTIKPASNSADSVTKCSIYQLREEVIDISLPIDICILPSFYNLKNDYHWKVYCCLKFNRELV